jgi:hypothetical protein
MLLGEKNAQNPADRKSGTLRLSLASPSVPKDETDRQCY